MPAEQSSRCRKIDCSLCRWRRTHEKRIDGVIHYPREARIYNSAARPATMNEEIQLTSEQEQHLDSLAESGITNPFEAQNSLVREFGLKKQDAAAIVKLYAEKRQREAMQ